MQLTARWIYFLLVSLFLAGCSLNGANRQEDGPLAATAVISLDPATTRTTGLQTVVATPPAAAPTAAPLGYTHQQADGNRLVTGEGSLPETTPQDIALAGTPQWVTAIPWQSGILWGVLLEGGFSQAFLVKDGQVEPQVITPRVLVNLAPHLSTAVDGPFFVESPVLPAGANHPVRLNEQGDYAFSDAEGRLYFLDGRGRSLGSPEVTILPDGRLLVDEQGRLLVLTDPTERYDHAVLGDPIEAAGVALITARPQPQLLTQIDIPFPQVVEGIAPIWTDWDGDGLRDIIVTLADSSQGAQVAVFDETGQQRAAGPAIGQGYRWRHQIAVAPFGPQGELELAGVRTPHLGGVVEFYRWQGEQLEIVAELPGYSSHVIGSRNLDLGAAGDFDGDGRVELLLPDQGRTVLAAIQREDDGAVERWRLPSGDKISTNIGAAPTADGQIALGIGREDGVLRIWQP